jgi:hypothetical protein
VARNAGRRFFEIVSRHAPAESPKRRVIDSNRLSGMERPDDFASRYQASAERLFARIEGACAGEADWPLGLRAALEAALAFLAAEPAAARILLVEPYEVGGEAQLRHDATLSRLAELLRIGREHLDAGPMPDTLEESLIGALVFIVERPLRRGEPEQLLRLAPELIALLLTPYLGREQAERLAR